MKKQLLLISILISLCTLLSFGQNFKIKRIAPAVSAPGSTVKVTLKVPSNFQYTSFSSVILNFKNIQDGSSFSNRNNLQNWSKAFSNDTLLTGNISIPISAILGYFDAALSVTSCPSCNFNGGTQITLGTSTSSSLLLLGPAKTIQGNVFYDKNLNGIQDGTETVLKYFNVKVSSSISSNIISTNQNGVYTYYAETGTYTVMPVFTSPWSSTSTNPRIVTISNTSILGINFGGTRPLMPGTVSSSFSLGRLRCNSTVTGTINYWTSNGTDISSGTVRFRPDPLSTISGYSPTYNSTSGDTLIWNFTDLSPYDYRKITLSVRVPDFNFIGRVLKYNILTSNGTSTSPYNYSDEVRCSWDPNDITLYSTGRPNPDSLLLTTPYLDYQIRFENKGNDTAYVVSVVDTLDTNLDFDSFQMISASHTVNIAKNEAAKRLEFRFNNIMLPFTKIDSIKSQGFIKYRVRTKSALTNGSRVKALAYIYFDANPAVLTNTLNTVFADNVRVESLEAEFSAKNILVFPNPSSGELNIYSETTGITFVEVFDIFGTRVAEKVWNPSVNSIDISHLANGSYIYSITNTRGKAARGLIIKN